MEPLHRRKYGGLRRLELYLNKRWALFLFHFLNLQLSLSRGNKAIALRHSRSEWYKFSSVSVSKSNGMLNKSRGKFGSFYGLFIGSRYFLFQSYNMIHLVPKTQIIFYKILSIVISHFSFLIPIKTIVLTSYYSLLSTIIINNYNEVFIFENLHDYTIKSRYCFIEIVLLVDLCGRKCFMNLYRFTIVISYYFRRII